MGRRGLSRQAKVIRQAAPEAQDMTSRRIRYKNYVDEQAKRKNTTKARVRSKWNMLFAYSNVLSDLPRCATVESARITSGYAQPSRWSISTSTAIGWLRRGRSVS